MYPTLYDLVLDLFGLSIPPFKLVQSFGMMVALAFVSASLVMASELKRKEKLGLLETTTKKVWFGKPSTITDKLISALIGFVIGYKLLALFTDFDAVSARPQDFILSMEGSLLGGILGAALSVGVRIWEDRKDALPKPELREVTMHPYEHVGNFTMLAAVSGILGAKLFHNLENIDEMMADPMGALLSFSGMSFYGGLICAAIVLWSYARKNNIKLIHLTDATTPGLILAYGVGRIGCQIAGDGDWGIPNDAPKPDWMSFLPDWMWAYNYPNNVLGIDLKEDFLQNGYLSLTGYAYPTPLYETLMAFAIFGFLWAMRKRWNVPGLMSSWYILLIGVERLLIEQIRINNEYHIFGFGITQAEIISVIMITMGVLGIVFIKQWGQKLARY
jgi:prolipoprotein diacylglyceryl transferase